MKTRTPRLAARAIIMHENRLLLVNAFRTNVSDLWCAPGGGIEAGHSIPDNLIREVREETGLVISVGAVALVNEFHDPQSRFHQVEVFFRCEITSGQIDHSWRDPERVVTNRRFFSQSELPSIRLKPDSLPSIAFAPSAPARYDPLEIIVR
ncbi:MAG: NUDIX domain-containing protein [Paracoccaceae bacterium]|jgi:ADP-ribose pyrophosphatase YjhB (NUDIX family)|nr:NUDIX domain-containing protein [Paracoccaceae bacterium]MDH5531276.1 NUDIX domain-containing protein [Paracoccaceae bacterium]